MKQKVKNAVLLKDSSPLLPSVHHLIQISARFMLRLKSEKEKRHFEAHGLQTCLVDCTEKYCMKNGHMSKWLAKKALADFRLRVNRSNHSIVHFWIKWKEVYVNQPWQNQDEWQLSHLRSRKHECSTSGICTRPDHHTWGLRWISCGVSKAVRSWPNRGFDWDVVEYIYTNRDTHTRARALTFDSWEVNAGMLMNSNTVADDPEGAFLKRTWTRHQLREKDKIIVSSPFFQLNDCKFSSFFIP